MTTIKAKPMALDSISHLCASSQATSTHSQHVQVGKSTQSVQNSLNYLFSFILGVFGSRRAGRPGRSSSAVRGLPHLQLQPIADRLFPVLCLQRTSALPLSNKSSFLIQ